MNEDVLKIVKERGLLLEKDICDLLENIGDAGFARELLESLERVSGQKIISKNVLNKNFDFVKGAVNKLPGDDREMVEKSFVKLGISVEIGKEFEIIGKGKNIEEAVGRGEVREDYQVFSPETKNEKKLEVQDFVGHFRARYMELQRILMGRNELQDLVSINKISGDRRSMSIIGILTDKRITKNKNLILTFEDLTGEVIALVKQGSEIFEKASELQLDDVVGVKASGSRDMLFVHDIFWPDSFKERVKFEKDIEVAFLSDVHVGSDRHFGEEFKKFVKWLNEAEDAKKIRYLFFVGDNVDGVGIFPGQEKVLDLKSMKEQYDLLASYLKGVPKKITMFMCAGQHDATRVAEPQPIVDKDYAGSLYDINNLILVTNPSTVKLLEAGREIKILMYHGASIHTFINEIDNLRKMNAHQCPAKAVREMLKRRHLAPVHGSSIYIPGKRDGLVIYEVPDIFCTGEVHKPDIENYNGTLIITGSCWQATTPFEEKVGNIPDPCKVPVYNLKTGSLRVLDFTGRGDEN
jgi:DNA polymerase II small subunit